MNATAILDAKIRNARAPTRLLAFLTAGLLMFGILGNAMTTAPSASAVTPAEALYISLLAEDGIGPAPGYDWNDLIFLGHAIAYDVRSGVHPAKEAYDLWLESPYLTKDEAITVVVAAVVAFAPELVPSYTGDPPTYADRSQPGDMVA